MKGGKSSYINVHGHMIKIIATAIYRPARDVLCILPERVTVIP